MSLNIESQLINGLHGSRANLEQLKAFFSNSVEVEVPKPQALPL